jgi:hypothetical protein
MNNRQPVNQRPNRPVPEKYPGKGVFPMSILSVVISLLFVFYGGYVGLNSSGDYRQVVFGIATCIYGLLGLAALGCAYRYRSFWNIVMTMFAAICYLVFYVIYLSAGLLSGIQLSGFFLLTLALWCNWIAVTKAVRAK